MLFKNPSKRLGEVLNGANLITLIGLWIIAIVVVLRFNGQANMLTALLTFSVVATDFFDGRYARKYKCITEFGTILDRIRDKLLSGFYFWFILISYENSGQSLYSIFLGTLLCLFTAEVTLFLSGIWGIVKNRSVKSNNWGKRKMFFECVGMIAWVIANDVSPLGIRHTDLVPAIFILLCFIASFFLAGMSLKGYWEIYFPAESKTA